ncbi:PASTA domain protein [Mycobacteroides salmoniphilum]|nr:PASTA domain protein [Mycobacteroides salmoniphilum]
MRVLQGLCVVGGLLAGCSTPAGPPDAPAESSSVQPKITATAPPLLVMRDLVGMQWADAEPICFDLGLVNFQVKDVAIDDPDKVGRIIAQDPPAGALVRPGSVVILTFGINPASERSDVEKR